MQKILGISRSPRFSPNSESRDEAIFNSVAYRLTSMGYAVSEVCEDDFTSAQGFSAAFSMARDTRILRKLSAYEAEGLLVVNSSQALIRNTRAELTRLFEAEGIPQPISHCIDTLSFSGGWTIPVRGCWLKRGDACAQSRGDVRFISTDEELSSAVQEFALRGIRSAVLSEHLVGDLVKFYGVEGTDFFQYYYPTSGRNFSKFGLEEINGAPSLYPFEPDALKICADRAARLSGMPVYGGDCVVAHNGLFRIIDFNDWPSFSRCREAAADAIVEALELRLNGGAEMEVSTSQEQTVEVRQMAR